MGNNSKKNSHVAPLHKTLEALEQIRAALVPFLRLLKDHPHDGPDSSSSSTSSSKRSSSRQQATHGAAAETTNPPLDPHRRAEAEAAVALSLGTLRYMGARLRGLDRGRKKNDPLRMELDKIRGMLLTLRKMEQNKQNEHNKQDKQSDDADDAKYSASITFNAPSEKNGTAAKRSAPPPPNDQAEVSKASSPSSGSSSLDATKRRKILNVDAGQRMIQAALAGGNKPSDTHDANPNSIIDKQMK